MALRADAATPPPELAAFGSTAEFLAAGAAAAPPPDVREPPHAHARRSRWAARWRVWAASAAVVGTLAVVAIAALEMVLGWRAQDATIRRSLDRYASSTAQAFGEGLTRRFADIPFHAMAPLVGAGAWRRREPLALDALAEHLRSLPFAGAFAEDSQLAVFQVDVRANAQRRAAVLALGVRARPAVVRAIVDTLLPAVERWRGFNSPMFALVHRAGGFYAVTSAWQNGRPGEAVALHGVVGDGARTVGWASAASFRDVALVPPSLAGPADGALARTGGLGTTAEAARRRERNARYVAVRVRTGPAVLYVSPNWAGAGFATSPYRSTYTLPPSLGPVAVDAVLHPDSEGALAEASAARASRPLHAGALLLATTFAVAALLGLRRQQELARARELFVASISHELRTPLTQIRLMSETLLLGRAKSPEQAQRWVRVIDREARRLGDLVENALFIARDKRHEVAVSPRPIALAPVVEAALDDVRPFAEARSARFDVALPDDVRVTADETALRHVLVNLLDNAVKYGPVGQSVCVTAAAAPHGVDVVIADRGAGVAAADRERIWEPFVRLGGHDGASGTGLGLAVVRALVERQRGRVWVDAAPSGGARFTVRLPAA